MHLYGRQVAREALNRTPRLVRKILVDDLAQMADLNAGETTVETCRREVLDELSDGGHHQGIVLDFQGFPYSSVDDIVDAASDATTFLVLDQIQDPQNLGAILRTAAAFDVCGVVLARDGAAAVTASAIRASAGLALAVPVAQARNIAETLVLLRDHGFWSTALVMDGQPLSEIDFSGRSALVVGSEGKGVRRLVRERCDFGARIPISDAVDSLNASTAAAIALYAASIS